MVGRPLTKMGLRWMQMMSKTLKSPAKGSRNLNTGPGGWFGHQAAIFFITYLFLGVKRLKKSPDIVPFQLFSVLQMKSLRETMTW